MAGNPGLQDLLTSLLTLPVAFLHARHKPHHRQGTRQDADHPQNLSPVAVTSARQKSTWQKLTEFKQAQTIS